MVLVLPSLFWVVTQCMMVVYRRFGTSYRAYILVWNSSRDSKHL